MKKILLILLSSLIVFSCSKKDAEIDQNTEKDVIDLAEEIQEMESGSQNAKIFEMANFTMELPEDWLQEPPDNQMRKAQFSLKNDNSVKIIAFNFGENSGSAEENIARWENEFTKVDNSNTLDLKEGMLKVVRIHGTFKMKPRPMAQEFTEMENFMTMAAIVPSNEGPYYFKLNGPKDIVESQNDNFVTFIESYNQK